MVISCLVLKLCLSEILGIDNIYMSHDQSHDPLLSALVVRVRVRVRVSLRV